MMDGHEGHNHPPFDQEMFEKLMADVTDAKIIDNLFLIPALNPPRFIMAQVNADGDISTLGYIPFDFMLDVGIGFLSAVRTAVKLGMSFEGEMPEPPENDNGGDDAPLAGGLYRVI